jgi:hypothetical protein
MIKSRMILAWKRQEIHTQFWLEKSEQKRPLRIPRYGWEDNIKMDLKRNRVEGCQLEPFDLGKGPGTRSCKHSNEPSDSIKR